MPHSYLKHIIWDWNGTLLDDIWLCVELINSILAKRGLPTVNTDSYKNHFGFPVIHYYHVLGFNLEEESFEDISGEFIGLYQSRWRECRLHPRARDTLSELGKLGYSQSVLSASGQQALDEAVIHFGLDRYFLRLIGQGDDFAHGKLESGKSWVNDLDWEPGEILLVGDTLHDYEVARDLGLHCALVDCGHHHRGKLEKTGVRVFDSHEQLIPFLASTFARKL